MMAHPIGMRYLPHTYVAYLAKMGTFLSAKQEAVGL